MFGIDDLIAGGVGAIGGVVSSIFGGNAQKKAINAAINTQKESLQELEPWQQAGTEALNAWREKVMAGPGEFTESEGYKFTLGEGEKAIKRGASTSAGFGTGAMGKSLIRYGQGLASNEYDKFQDRYLKSLVPFQSLAGVGQWALGNEMNVRNQISDLQVDKGIAQSNMYTGISNSVRGGISDAVTMSGLPGSGGLTGGSVPINAAPTYAPSSLPLGYNPSQYERY